MAVDRLPCRVALPCRDADPGKLLQSAACRASGGVAEATERSDSLSSSQTRMARPGYERPAAARLGTSLLVVEPPRPLLARDVGPLFPLPARLADPSLCCIHLAFSPVGVWAWSRVLPLK